MKELGQRFVDSGAYGVMGLSSVRVIGHVLLGLAQFWQEYKSIAFYTTKFFNIPKIPHCHFSVGMCLDLSYQN